MEILEMLKDLMGGENTLRQQRAEFEKMKADFVKDLPGADDEITITRGDFMIRTYEVMAKLIAGTTHMNTMAILADVMKNKIIAKAIEIELFGEPEEEAEGGGDEE